ncbi:hypothetical protein NMG60_11031622 [Bertholletia excelsa]
MRDGELFWQIFQIQKQKGCLNVLDDVWLIDAWHSLSHAFPEVNAGSKILLTTRDKTVASRVIPQHHFLHQPQYLNEDEGWHLFQKKSALRKDSRI